MDKEYRGFGLQRFFIEMREGLARSMGAEEVLVTIAGCLPPHQVVGPGSIVNGKITAFGQFFFWEKPD